MIFLLRAILLCLFFGLLNHQLGQETQADPVRIELKKSAELKQEVVRLADVSNITGGTLLPRRRIADLDVATLAADEERILSRRQIDLRVRLAGFSPDDFSVVGANSVEVHRLASISAESQILNFLKPELARRLGIEIDELEVRLLRPIPKNISALFTDPVQLSHNLRTRLRLGTITTNVSVTPATGATQSFSLALQTMKYREVLVATRPLPKGAMISSEDVKKERRLIDHSTLRNLPPNVIGSQLKRSVPEQAILSKLDLTRPTTKRKDYVIRSRDIVEIVARRGGLKARVAGAVALQNGSVGESIRVKNPSSGRILNGEVVSPGLVLIRL